MLADSESKLNPGLPATAPPPVPELAAQPLPKGTRVLQIGDSFAAALGGELGKLFKEAGVRSTLEYKTASYIPNWSYEGDVPKFVANYQPDLVLITLGANEIEIPKPEERIKPIKHLVSTLGGRPCVWIAPPLWKPDTGLLKVIRENIAPCRYLDSNALVQDLPRRPRQDPPERRRPANLGKNRVRLAGQRAPRERPATLGVQARTSGDELARSRLEPARAAPQTRPGTSPLPRPGTERSRTPRTRCRTGC